MSELTGRVVFRAGTCRLTVAVPEWIGARYVLLTRVTPTPEDPNRLPGEPSKILEPEFVVGIDWAGSSFTIIARVGGVEAPVAEDVDFVWRIAPIRTA